MSLDVLLHHGVLHHDDKALGRVRKALDGMRAGGVWDQLGGGFHRYSTDERWLVPHFEKMLYDNALLLRLYTDAWRVFREERYARTVREIVRWLEREMSSPEGGFFATQDADSEGHEGKFFVWTPEEVRLACGDDAPLACAHYGVTEEGNFEDSPSSVLSLAKPAEELSLRFAMAPSEVEKRLEVARAAMLAHREKRPKPFRDDKILTSWNALLIGALADASRAQSEPSWLGMAQRAFDFVWGALVKDGRALRHFMDGVARGTGFLDDHAFLGCAALDLYEATGEPRYLANAKTLAEAIRSRFMQKDVLYLTPDDGEPLIARTQDLYDHSIPSATSMAVLLFLRLGALAVPELTSVAEQQLEGLCAAAEENPFGLSQTVLLVDRLARGPTDVVLIGDSPELLKAAFEGYIPHRNIGWKGSLLAEGKDAPKPCAFVCRDRSCSPPAFGYRELLGLLSPPTP
jgi:hypothetical protein